MGASSRSAVYEHSFVNIALVYFLLCSRLVGYHLLPGIIGLIHFCQASLVRLCCNVVVQVLPVNFTMSANGLSSTKISSAWLQPPWNQDYSTSYHHVLKKMYSVIVFGLAFLYGKSIVKNFIRSKIISIPKFTAVVFFYGKLSVYSYILLQYNNLLLSLLLLKNLNNVN